MDTRQAIQIIAVAIIPAVFAITLHEVAHGWLANKCGDKTAAMMGRITLNPFKHISILGTIIVPIVLLFSTGFIFGWAKPVPVAWHNLRNPRRDMALVALAGPTANLLMAIGWGLVAKLATLLLFSTNKWLVLTSNFLQAASYLGVVINCLLMVFNLIPIPPLDGSRIISSFLPASIAHTYEKIEPYGIFILIGLILLKVPIGPFIWGPSRFLSDAILSAFGISK